MDGGIDVNIIAGRTSSPWAADVDVSCACVGDSGIDRDIIIGVQRKAIATSPGNGIRDGDIAGTSRTTRVIGGNQHVGQTKLCLQVVSVNNSVRVCRGSFLEGCPR